MTKYEKTLYKFKESPESLHFREIDKILKSLDFIKLQGKGSHVKYSYLSIFLVFSLHNGDCKGYQKKQALKKIKHLLS